MTMNVVAFKRPSFSSRTKETQLVAFPNQPDPLLEVRNFSAALSRDGKSGQILKDVSFSVQPGERVGIVGESGCGKSVTGLAILGLIPNAFRHLSGEILFNGENLLGLSSSGLRRVRGRQISMIFQEPMTTLDPVFTVGEQISETLRTHFPVSKREAKERAIDVLARVGIPAPRHRYDDYPHQLSGGMRQRAMIAIALVCEPRLIIADEPTTALDVTVQAQIIKLLVELSEQIGTALLFITHDIGVVAESCQRMLTMYAGQVVEDSPVDPFLLRPYHPYSSGLLRSIPSLSPRKSLLPSIPGRVPSAFEMPEGCRFQPRCSYAESRCSARQVLENARDDRSVACCRHDELVLSGVMT
jgi:peptide/nickel transport system ATP-binding protein